ncbi:MAG: hypothetical protein M3R03_06020 [Pseudomonadota bacterium]|nr:hypothetical protein [Pseudomonadota bacterium]
MIAHLALALGLQLLVVGATRSWWAGAFAAAAWAISRELTQAEYRWIEHHGGGLRANMPWWGGFDPIVWQTPDPWLDWLAPTLFGVIIALIATRRARRRTPLSTRLRS